MVECGFNGVALFIKRKKCVRNFMCQKIEVQSLDCLFQPMHYAEKYMGGETWQFLVLYERAYQKEHVPPFYPTR